MSKLSKQKEQQVLDSGIFAELVSEFTNGLNYDTFEGEESSYINVIHNLSEKEANNEIGKMLILRREINRKILNLKFHVGGGVYHIKDGKKVGCHPLYGHKVISNDIIDGITEDKIEMGFNLILDKSSLDNCKLNNHMIELSADQEFNGKIKIV